jgi:hypothetical protein
MQTELPGRKTWTAIVEQSAAKAKHLKGFHGLLGAYFL